MSDVATASKKTPAIISAQIQVTVERALLLKSLSHIQTVVERRGTIPILANVKLEAQPDDSLHLTATDMDVSLSETIAAKVETSGATTVAAHMFYDIVRKLPDGSQIELKSDGNGKVIITSGQAKFTLSTLAVEEFPVMAEGELEHGFTLNTSEFSQLMDKPSYAMSNEETRYYLNGIYFHAVEEDGNKILRTVSTDGHRLARTQITLPNGAENIPGVIIPKKTVHEVRKLMEAGEGDVKISLSDTKIRIAYGNGVLISKLIDGTFPDYDRVIPKENDKLLEAECKQFTHAVDRVSVISNERSRGVRFNIEQGKITFSASSAEQGSASEELEVTYGAESLEIGFNSRYLLEMMQQIEGDTAQFLFNDGASPVLVRDTADVNTLYVIMPMRV